MSTTLGIIISIWCLNWIYCLTCLSEIIRMVSSTSKIRWVLILSEKRRCLFCWDSSLFGTWLLNIIIWSSFASSVLTCCINWLRLLLEWCIFIVNWLLNNWFNCFIGSAWWWSPLECMSIRPGSSYSNKTTLSLAFFTLPSIRCYLSCSLWLQSSSRSREYIITASLFFFIGIRCWRTLHNLLMSIIIKWLNMIEESFFLIRLEVPTWSTHNTILMSSIFNITELGYTLEHIGIVLILWTIQRLISFLLSGEFLIRLNNITRTFLLRRSWFVYLFRQVATWWNIFFFLRWSVTRQCSILQSIIDHTHFSNSFFHFICSYFFIIIINKWC